MMGAVTVVHQRAQREAHNQWCYDVLIVVSTGWSTRQHQRYQPAGRHQQQLVSVRFVLLLSKH
jgi:hypothetical protein